MVDDIFPPGFVPGGDIIPDATPAAPTDLDATPTIGSLKGVRSNGVAEALDDKEPTIEPPTENAVQKVWVGTKEWRDLPTWIQSLVGQLINDALEDFDWQQVSDQFNLITEEADPTVPAHVKSITEEQKEALAWFSSNFSRENLTPGHVVIIGQDGDSLQIMPLGELLTPFFPALSSVLSGVVAPITSLSIVQQVNDIKVTWTDITRKAGYYQVEMRHRIQNGDWTQYVLLNQPDFSVKEHLWERTHIPTGVTHVGVRVRYLDKENVPSEWKLAETTFNSNAPVITETLYERVAFSGRWWSQGAVVEETQYERVAYSGRWWSETVAPEPEGDTPPTAPNPIVVARNAANQINVTIPLELPHNPMRLFELNYRVVGTEAWRVYTNTGLLAAPATPALLSGPNNGQANFSFLLQNAYFTQGRIEARARSWQNSVASPWSTIVAEPISGGGGGSTTLPSSYVLHYYMSQANGFLDLVVEKGVDGLPYISDN
ncbi:hypothetical protein, partial [Runella zeae]|uniref:hypothetical protein n=1 Tax=Runella zeae TaxID=94255 RepID=UPI00048EC4F9